MRAGLRMSPTSWPVALLLCAGVGPACTDDGGGTDTSTSEGTESSTGDGDGDTTGDGDGDGDGTPCSSSGNCSEDEYCEFGGLGLDDCGVWGTMGECGPRPEGCDAGGIGACGCTGLVTLNDCELNAQGDDWFEFGGCELGEAGTFRCAELDCDGATQMCSISYNDVAGPDEPDYFANCVDLPDQCEQGDCACIDDAFGACFDAGGFTVVLYPGG